MYDSLFEVLDRVGAETKPIAVVESGYSADPYRILGTPFLASPEKQDRYLKLMLYELEKTGNPLKFIINHYVRDNDYTWFRQYIEGQNGIRNPLFVEFSQYFRDTGLFDGDGGEGRPALQRWRDMMALPLSPAP